jgi:hypothetical protein
MQTSESLYVVLEDEHGSSIKGDLEDRRIIHNLPSEAVFDLTETSSAKYGDGWWIQDAWLIPSPGLLELEQCIQYLQDRAIGTNPGFPFRSDMAALFDNNSEFLWTEEQSAAADVVLSSGLLPNVYNSYAGLLNACRVSWMLMLGCTAGIFNYMERVYGELATGVWERRLRADPWKALAYCDEAGFLFIDRNIAASLGIALDDERRLKACINWVIRTAGKSDGHTVFPAQHIQELAGEYIRPLQTDSQLFNRLVLELIDEGELWSLEPNDPQYKEPFLCRRAHADSSYLTYQMANSVKGEETR